MANMRLYKRLLLRLVFFILFLMAMFYAAPFVFSLFSPFILAFAIAAALNPAVSFLEKKFRISRRFISFTVVLLVFLSLASLIAWFISSLVGEAVSLAGNIQIMLDYFTSSAELLTDRLKWLIDFLPGDTEETLSGILDSVFLWLKDASLGLADYILSNTKTMTVRAGNVILSTIMFILAAYFITVDYSMLGSYLRRFKGSIAYNRFNMIKNVSKLAFGGFLKAQLLLSLMAFVIIFAALVIYGQEYALLIALILTLIDFLPFLGTAVVLVPWGILCFIGGDTIKTIFLLALSASIFLLRRFVEPKIMSTQTGLSPLLALISTYVGMRLAGVWGIILGPVITVVIISIVKAGVFENTKQDIKELFNELSNILRRED